MTTFKFYGMTPQDAVTCILGGAFRYNNGQHDAVVQGLRWAEQLAELLRMQSAWDAVGNKVSIKIADSNPAGTPGAQAASAPDLPPPFDSQEEAQRAAGIWPQEAEPATVHRYTNRAEYDDALERLCDYGAGVAPAPGSRIDFNAAQWAGSAKTGMLGVGAGHTIDAGGNHIIGAQTRIHTFLDRERYRKWFNTKVLATPPKPSALDEMAAQAASWHVGVDLARDGADAMAYMLRSAREPAPAPTGIDATLVERGSRYGKFEDHAAITMQLKNALRQRIYENTTKFQADQLEAIDMICHKLGRIVNGDPNYADSWVDIAGYAKLVADRLEGVSR